MAVSIDPLGRGALHEPRAPGGNITGLTISVGPEIEGKRLGLLRETRPGVSRVACLGGKEDKD